MPRTPEIGPDIAIVAQLLGDRTRALMVSELATGEPLSASSLAALVSVSRPTASEHLAKLVEGGVLHVERVGRHAYYRLASEDVAVALRALASVAPGLTRPAAAPTHGPGVLSTARTCYDHLGGRLGVALTDVLQERGLICRRAQEWEVAADAWDAWHPLGITCAPLKGSRRPIVRGCADWNGPRHHIAGGLAAAVTERLFSLGWLTRVSTDARLVTATAAGVVGLRRTFGLSLSDFGPDR
ncbi:ArsR family transcriptional regulator [Streptomyces sp. BHT-5-2]|uniref:ArsR/SmtB family transcription factor n=1 Tax=unclassified Streptomyces TaxID=2593676 RepID=UPI001C8DB57F|nr:helix-turn-helix transcriptional regulator [Streptomyces sp. BHT-5-2]QZL05435.1 ArsR family transcriptional regulator [Streptomyces sp. BHT-5-2]